MYNEPERLCCRPPKDTLQIEDEDNRRKMVLNMLTQVFILKLNSQINLPTELIYHPNVNL